MKIEMVLPTLQPAGMETVVAGLTRGLARRGHDVGVTCIEEKGALGLALERDGHRVSLVPTPGLRTILLPAALQQWLTTLRPDVVHIHSGAWLKAARAAALARVPRVIYTMHGIDGSQPSYIPWMERWAARYTHVVAPVSQAFVAYLQDRARVPTAKLCVIINGIDVGRFSPGPRSGLIRRRFELGEDDCVIGHVARFSPVKNHAMLIAAFARVVQERPHAFLALIGDGPLRAGIEARVDTFGIRERVGFLGQLSDLPAVYRDLDVLVLPSFSEATSISILEGMASGLPIAATSVGGTPALLGDGTAGRLVPNDDAGALAATLIEFIDDPVQRSRMGAVARERARTLYGEEMMLDAYEAVYTSDLGAPA